MQREWTVKGCTAGSFFKKVTTIGLVIVLVAVVGGCTSINKSGLDLRNESGEPTFADPIERPIIRPIIEPIEPKEWTGEETLDDLFAKIAQQVPAFGGMFIDEQDSITVYLTDLNPSVAAAAEAAIRAAFGDDERLQRPMRMLQGQYGFLQLKDWYDRMAPEVLALPGTVLTDIDEAKNRLVIGIESLQMQRQATALLASLGIPLEAVTIEETKPVEFELRNHRRPLVGGIQISSGNWFSYFTCTLGVIATRSGVSGFVTNSHCTSIQGGVEGTVYQQPKPPLLGTGNRIGLETADPEYFTGGACPAGRRCRYSDSAFVRVPHPSGPSTSVSKGYIARTSSGSYTWNGTDRFRITSELLSGSPIVGERVAKVGRTTGRTEGTVTRTCFQTNVSDNGRDTGITMLCQNQASYSSAGGDSGSPVFQITNSPSTNDVRIIGIHWGSGGAFSSTGTVGVQRPSELGYIYMCAPPYGC